MKSFALIFWLIWSFQPVFANPAQTLTIEKWRVVEISLVSRTSYPDPFNQVEVTATFSGPGAAKIILPAFWDGAGVWKVRFAPTATGTWKMNTSCSDPGNSGLNGISKIIECVPYKGNMEIYQHGFLKINSGQRYFSYADGKPFFYIGDTHWNMPAEYIDSSSVAGIASQFKYIIDKRVVQGFTVIQSEPIGAKYDLKDGLTDADIAGFQDLDKHFQYIADKGLVHANAELLYATELGANMSKFSKDYLGKLSRYWVARYAAYPVLWTTAQEVDNDCYHGRIDNGKDMNPYYDSTSNPWKLVFSYIRQYDPYRHPQTAHQEFASLKGDGTAAYNSSFKNIPGHAWFGVQWSPAKNEQLDFSIPKDFWLNGQDKPVVNYEGHYDHLWTNEFGARMQGWTAYLNGMCGFGYGVADIWLFNSTYDMEKESVRSGITITVEEKKAKWDQSVEFKSAYQMGYMRTFFQTIDWWTLTPRFDDSTWVENQDSRYSVASDGDRLYVAYFYNNQNRNSGTLKKMMNTTYTIQWFNPVTGRFQPPSTVSITGNQYRIGDKPDNGDWVLLVKKAG